MRITFLGTGPAGRIPRPGCNRLICKEARKKGSKSARLQSSAFFEFPHFNVLIDVTQDFKKQLARIDGNPPKFSKENLSGQAKIDYVFLTHGHYDAAGGLPELARFMKQTEMPEVVYIERHVLKTASEEMSKIDPVRSRPAKGTATIALRRSASNGIDLPFHHLVPNKTLDFKDFKVIPFRVVHSFNPKFPTLGYLFKVGPDAAVGAGKKLVYASDFKRLPPSAKKLMKGADLAILDCAAYERPIPNHQSLPEILKLTKELGFKKVYLTQVGIAWPPHEQAQKYINKYAKNIFLAYDGLKLDI